MYVREYPRECAHLQTRRQAGGGCGGCGLANRGKKKQNPNIWKIYRVLIMYCYAVVASWNFPFVFSCAFGSQFVCFHIALQPLSWQPDYTQVLIRTALVARYLLGLERSSFGPLFRPWHPAYAEVVYLCFFPLYDVAVRSSISFGTHFAPSQFVLCLVPTSFS